MGTPLDIEDSVLSAVKELAQRQGKTAGEVLSTLARQALPLGAGAADRQQRNAVSEPPASDGFRPRSANGDTLASNTWVNKLRDELGV